MHSLPFILILLDELPVADMTSIDWKQDSNDTYWNAVLQKLDTYLRGFVSCIDDKIAATVKADALRARRYNDRGALFEVIQRLLGVSADARSELEEFLR